MLVVLINNRSKCVIVCSLCFNSKCDCVYNVTAGSLSLGVGNEHLWANLHKPTWQLTILVSILKFNKRSTNQVLLKCLLILLGGGRLGGISGGCPTPDVKTNGYANR